MMIQFRQPSERSAFDWEKTVAYPGAATNIDLEPLGLSGMNAVSET